MNKKLIWLSILSIFFLIWGILVFYGLIAFAALTLILALPDSANRSTSFSAQRKTSRNESHQAYLLSVKSIG